MKPSRRDFLNSAAAAAWVALFAGKLPSAAHAGKTNAPAFDFRRVRWGMSHAEVLAAEDLEPHLNMTGVIMYKESIADRPVTISYQFAERDDELCCVAAVVQTDLGENMLYLAHGEAGSVTSQLSEALEDYDRLKAYLRSEAGEPVEEDRPYQDDELLEAIKSQSSSEQLGEQMAGIPELANMFAGLQKNSHDEATLKKLMKYTRWSAERTTITLGMAPMVFGGTLLMVRHDSNELSRLLAGHSDFKPST